MFKGWAILPAAQCLFGKTKVTLADIAREWKNGTVVVMQKPNGQFHYIAGCSGSYGKIGQHQDCYHDQTGAQFGTWVIVNEITYKDNGDGTTSYQGVAGVDLTRKAAMAVFK
jgi:hypothetical protein